MQDEPKRWQASIWIGEKADQPITVYGESLPKLRAAARDWLRENKPLFFGNAPPGYEITRRANYAYSDGTTLIPISEKPLEEGWYWVQGSLDGWSYYPDELEDFDSVVSHFVERWMIPEKGPDYQEVAIVEGNLQLHLIKTVRRETVELYVNDLLQRGWYVIALDCEGTTTERGMHLVNRRTVFVLGHPEENASYIESDPRSRRYEQSYYP